jgi:hypothetical protein
MSSTEWLQRNDNVKGLINSNPKSQRYMRFILGEKSGLVVVEGFAIV